MIYQEVDVACFPNTGFLAYDVSEFAVYLLGDSYGIIVRYPMTTTANDGPIHVFSLNVICF